MKHRPIFPKEAEFSTTPRTFSFVWVQRAWFPTLVIPTVRSNAGGSYVGFSLVQSLSPVWLFATPWITARKVSLSITNSRSSLRLMSIKSAMPSSHLILCRPPFSFCPQFLPASESFPMSQLFAWGGQRNGVSALASFLPKNSQGWSPSEWTGWISLQSKGLSRWQ